MFGAGVARDATGDVRTCRSSSVTGVNPAKKKLRSPNLFWIDRLQSFTATTHAPAHGFFAQMSSRFSLLKPYVVASLPQPIGHAEGQYVVAEVYGGAPGTKKRKRSELAVGIDGEGVNLYDVGYRNSIIELAADLT